MLSRILKLIVASALVVSLMGARCRGGHGEWNAKGGCDPHPTKTECYFGGNDKRSAAGGAAFD